MEPKLEINNYFFYQEYKTPSRYTYSIASSQCVDFVTKKILTLITQKCEVSKCRALVQHAHNHLDGSIVSTYLRKARSRPT